MDTTENLLDEFARTRSEGALRLIIDRHLPLVYAVAFRVTRSEVVAREVAQDVFLKMAQRPTSLPPGLAFSAWLHRTTRSLAIDAVRMESRRLKRESTAAELRAMNTPDDSLEELAPLLDELIDSLPDAERELITARYFENLSFKRLGERLGIQEDAARLRVNRAVEKVRAQFAGRGVTTTAAALSDALPAFASAAVPAGLAASIASVVFASTAAASVTVLGVSLGAAKVKTFVFALLFALAGLTLLTVSFRQGSQSAGAAQQPVASAVGEVKPDNIFQQRFLALWKDLHNPKNGYFSQDGIPYHSVETLMIEAPDHGHMTTSEAFSFLIWLEAAYGRATGDWSKLENAWAVVEKHAIPSAKDQPNTRYYNAAHPATYAAEHETTAGYPSPLEQGVSVGKDPIFQDLKDTYKTTDVYGMHWLVDVDNWYGYGQRGDGKSRGGYLNTFQRGPQESVWNTVPHPSWDEFKWGGSNGFLSLFIGDKTYSRQWRYTTAPDADARVVQAMYWAALWAKAQKKEIDVSRPAKMGDFLRYSLFDKYFKKLGCTSPQGAAGQGYDSAHYLISWYYAWGGPIENQNWAFRIGCSHVHQGYQNPMAAWILSQETSFKPRSANGARDWTKSLERQLEFYRWLQTSEGAIAGGATNCWNGSYDKPPADASTFYGMIYDWQPVWHDPPSNNWFGFQCWSVERLAEYYHATNDPRAKAILDKWVAWAMKETKLEADGTYSVPGDLAWEGQPESWDPRKPRDNSRLHMKVVNRNPDVGVVGSLAKLLLHYSAGTKRWGTEDSAPAKLAVALLERSWKLYRDDRGMSAPELRPDYKRIFEEEVYVPHGWQGKMANGDVIQPGVKFLDIRSKYKADPDFARVKKAYEQKEAPAFRYHRFWAQVEYATACELAAEFAPAN